MNSKFLTFWKSTKDNLILFLFAGINVLLFFAIPSDFRFLAWDELSGWASKSKNVFNDDGLWTINSTMLGHFYPPGQELFHYFVLQFTGWNEKAILVSQNFMLLCCLVVIIQKIKTLKFTIIISIFLTMMCLGYSLNFGFYTILPDYLVAVYFSILLINSFSEPRKWEWVLFASTLVLLKPYGLVFVLISWLILILRVHLNPHSRIQDLTRWSAILIPPVFIYFSWRLWMSQNSIVSTSSGVNFKNLLVPENLDKVQETLHAFIRNLFFFDDFATGSFHLVSTTSLLIIILCLFISLSIISETFGKKDFFLVILTFFLFESFLFLSYILVFSTYESVRVASMTRYNSAVFFAVIVIFLYKLEESVALVDSIRSKTLIFFVSMGIIVSGNGFFQNLINVDEYKDARPQRQSLESFVGELDSFSDVNQRTYFIDQNTNGYTMWMFRYLVIPRGTNSWCWSVGEKYNLEDVWTCRETPNELFGGYTHLAIYNADQNFWQWALSNGIRVDFIKDRGHYKIQGGSKGSVISLVLQNRGDK
jgi:hypothetical protein